jgi:putative endonuclease
MPEPASRDERRSVGRSAEALAARYLERRGYGIIARNWRCAQGEIDLIARDGETLVFVEVRARRSSTRGLAEESVTRAKQQRLAALAEAYLYRLQEDGTPWHGPWRIDVIALRLTPDGTAGLRHLQHAVESL